VLSDRRQRDTYAPAVLRGNKEYKVTMPPPLSQTSAMRFQNSKAVSPPKKKTEIILSSLFDRVRGNSALLKTTPIPKCTRLFAIYVFKVTITV